MSNRAAQIQIIADNLGTIKRAMHTHLAPMAEEIGLSQAQVMLLHIIARHQPVSHKVLAGHMMTTRGSVSQLVDSLDKEGCILRSNDTADRRVEYVSVSPRGKQKLDEFKKLRNKVVSEAFENLSDEQLNSYVLAQETLIDWFDKNTK